MSSRIQAILFRSARSATRPMPSGRGSELAGAGPVEVTAVSGVNGELYRVRIGPLPNASRPSAPSSRRSMPATSDARLVVAQGIL